MRRVLLLFVGLLALASVAITSGTTPAQPRSARVPVIGRACTPVWRTTPSPQMGQGTLNAVVTVSSRDAWTVGGVVRLGGMTGGEIVAGTPLIEHWNGARWSVSPGPNISGVLTDVAATSRRDAWAVGFVPRSEEPLVLHWNGQRWTQVKLPTTIGAVDAVAALSSRDVWVVGTSHAGYSDTGEISHWDGRSWTRVVTRRDTQLADVAALSHDDVWVVGNTAGTDFYKALMLHFDGSRWQTFAQPATSGNDSAWLLSVGAISQNDVWAGGGEHMEEMSPPAIGPLMLHWDGGKWSYTSLGASGETEFVGLATVSPNEAWAVSSNSWSYESQGSFGYGTWHRSGGRWRAAELPHGWELYDIAAVRAPGAAPVVWAVGQVGTRIRDYATRTVPLIRRFGC